MTPDGHATRTGGRAATKGVIPGRYALSVGMPTTPPPEGWRWKPLTDVARMESGHTPSRKVPEYWNGDIPWVALKDATSNHGRVITATAEYISPRGLANSSARLLPSKTVSLSRTASVGHVVVLGREMTTSQDFANWVCSEDLDCGFLKYVFLAERESLLRFASGTTHQTIYYPELKALHVCIPLIDEQRRIAGALESFDSKIEHNRQMARFLIEVAARRLASMETESIEVGDVVTLAKGLSYKGSGLVEDGLPMFNLANFTREGWANLEGLKFYAGDFKEKHVVGARDLLVANTDLTQRREILGQPLLVPRGISQALFTHHVYALRFREGVEDYRLPLFLALRSRPFRDRATTFATGTTVAALPKDAVLGFTFTAPRKAELKSAAADLARFFNRAWAAEKESQNLARIRDLLIPKLMSGRIQLDPDYIPLRRLLNGVPAQ